MDFVGKPINFRGQLGQKQMKQALNTLGSGHVSQENVRRQKRSTVEHKPEYQYCHQNDKTVSVIRVMGL